jgi:hypothetical protein
MRGPPTRSATHSWSAGGCAETSDPSERGAIFLANIQSPDPTVQMFGLVAPGVHDLTITLANGETISPEVTDDGFALTTTSDPIRATWTKPDGSEGHQDRLVVRPTK